jgi:hypothetical protein
VGYVALEGECVVFVFPEHPDEDGNPRRVPWAEAACNAETLRRLQILKHNRAAVVAEQTA